MNRALQAQTAILDILFPRRCFSCNSIGSWLCKDCSRFDTQIEFFHIESFSVCSLFDFDQVAIREGIHNLKYGGISEAAKVLVDLARSQYGSFSLQEYCGSNSVLIPVPTSANTLKMRGYNQAEELAKELSEWLRLPVNAVFLQKLSTKKRSQVGKTAQERGYKKNLFYCSKTNSVSKDIRVVLVDDVCTTGSTLLACVKALQEYGIKEVRGVVISNTR